MSVSYTLDDVARTSDDAAVRTRFDAATLTTLRFAALLCMLVGLPHFVEASTTFRTILGGLSFFLGALTLLIVRKKAKNRLATFVQRRPRGAAMSFLLTQAALLIVFNANAGNEAVMAFTVIFAFFGIFLRLLPAEHILLHSLLAAITIAAVIVMPLKKIPIEHLIVPSVLVNAGALTAALLISRRMRRNIVADWTQRRTSAREQIRMRDELRYARELQLSMLPECAPALDWADICSISVPAAEVGGDYYDYFLDDGRVALVCGDVAGHGMASGLVLSAIRGGFALLRDSLHDPATVLRRLHHVVTQTTRRRMLVTLSFVLLDRAAGRVTIASAGHPPVIVRGSDGRVETVELFAPPLGVRLPVQIPQRQFPLRTGDMFVLHSDGVYETRDGNDQVYGLDRLERIVSEQGGGSAEEMRDAILRDLSQFRGTTEQDDDVTLVVCRITA